MSDLGEATKLLRELDDRLARLPAAGKRVAPIRLHLAAAAFALSPRDSPPLVAIVGGTGTGKSTLLNRLLDRPADSPITESSYLRTHTSGAIAAPANARAIPETFLALPHRVRSTAELPASGEPGSLAIVQTDHPLARQVTLIDTPDVDGEKPAHQAVADRVIRFVDAIVFVVTPEKYQMTQLPAYYTLAARYGTAARFVMNKTREQEAVEDYAGQLPRHLGREVRGGEVFAIARDGSAFAARQEQSMGALREALSTLGRKESDASASALSASLHEGRSNRLIDLAGEVIDGIVEPMRESRRAFIQLERALDELKWHESSIDVSPMTRQLQSRFREKSVAYLMGPVRVFDRVVRIYKGLASPLSVFSGGEKAKGVPPPLPDFRKDIADQLARLQAEIEIEIGRLTAIAAWSRSSDYAATKLPLGEAEAIVDDEMAKLGEWIKSRMNSAPRDTRVATRVLKWLPGGKKLSARIDAAEATPYVLALAALTPFFTAGTDWAIAGIYAGSVWLWERWSDEILPRTRAANSAIGDRFEALAERQIRATLTWLDSRIATAESVDAIERLANRIHEAGVKLSGRGRP